MWEGDGARGKGRMEKHAGQESGGFVGHAKENQGSSRLEDTDSTRSKV